MRRPPWGVWVCDVIVAAGGVVSLVLGYPWCAGVYLAFGFFWLGLDTQRFRQYRAVKRATDSFIEVVTAESFTMNVLRDTFRLIHSHDPELLNEIANKLLETRDGTR